MTVFIIILTIICLLFILQPDVDIGKVGERSALFLRYGSVENRKVIKLWEW